jgi:hypothetical protein
MTYWKMTFLHLLICGEFSSEAMQKQWFGGVFVSAGQNGYYFHQDTVRPEPT